MTLTHAASFLVYNLCYFRSSNDDGGGYYDSNTYLEKYSIKTPYRKLSKFCVLIVLRGGWAQFFIL
jgi:hypothetical protein